MINSIQVLYFCVIETMLHFKAIMFFINFIFINKTYFSSASEIVTDWSKWDGLKSPFLRAFAQSLKQETQLKSKASPV